MSDTDPYAAIAIADVERRTGLPRATIRIWERRYGFPQPLRDARGERLYPPQQVEQLGLMATLVARGHRPAKLVAMGSEAMQALAQVHEDVNAGARPPRVPRTVGQVLRLLKGHDAAAVAAELTRQLRDQGLARFAAEEVPAMARAVGEAWLAGQLEIHEEHLFSDCLQSVLRPAIALLAGKARPEAPTVVLTTLAGEPHGLGLLMAQAVFALQGCPTVSLGVRLPPEQVAAACRAYKADLLGLSFTASVNPVHVLRGLEELRGMLPPQVRIWAGGSAPVLQRRRIAGVRPVPDVRFIPDLLAEDFALPPV